MVIVNTDRGNELARVVKILERKDLPENAQKYLARIEEFVGVPVKFIGTGAGRDAMIVE